MIRKKKVGAPKGSRNAAKPDHLRKSRKIGVSMTESQHDRLERLANAAKMPKGCYLLERAEEGINAQPKESER